MKKKSYLLLLTLLLVTGCGAEKQADIPPVTTPAQEENNLPEQSTTIAPEVEIPPTIKEELPISPLPTTNFHSIKMPTSLETIPAEYKTPSNEAGTLEYFYYDTKYYDKDQSEMRKYALVYLPYGYDELDLSRHYTVVYLMHGRDDSPEHFFGTPEKPSANKNMIDHLIQQGMQPMIIIACDYYPNNKQVFNGDGDASMTKNFGQEFIKDLMPQAESHYHTYAQSVNEEDLIASRNHRIFAGFSMGAVTTWYRMADSMPYCAFFLPMSGTLYWGSEVHSEGLSATSFIPKYLDNEIAKSGYTNEDFIMVSCVGTNDFALKTMNAQIDLLKNKSTHFNFSNKEAFVNSYYYIGKNDPHDYVAAGKYLYNVLPLFSEMIGD